MLYLPESNLVFIHIHKNAGRSFKLALKFAYNQKYKPQTPVRPRTVGDIEDIPNHVSISKLYGLAPQLMGVPLLSVKRNPWDRLHSAFSWWNAKDESTGGINRDRVTGFEDFEDFVDKLYASYKREAVRETNRFYNDSWLQLRPNGLVYPDQLAYFRIDGEVQDCRFLAFENIGEELADLLEELFGAEAASRIERIGKSGKKDYRSAYTNEMRERVAEIYAEDAERLGYTFDG